MQCKSYKLFTQLKYRFKKNKSLPTSCLYRRYIPRNGIRFILKRQHTCTLHLLFISVTYTSATTRQANRYRLKMTNNKLQMLCMFALTICTVINDINCITKTECRKQILRTNHMISQLISEQKYELVKYLIAELPYEEIAEAIYPPDAELLVNIKDTYDAKYRKIYDSEREIQGALIKILGFKRPRFIDSGDTYDTAVTERKDILNTTFLDVLNDRLKNVQMCVNSESIKCALIGLIKRSLNNQSKNKQECTNDGYCVINSDESISTPGQTSNDETPGREKYLDKFITAQGCYKTYIEDPKRQVLIAWDGKTKKVVESGPSGEKKD